MASTSETGHDIDITNSKAVIKIAEGITTEYQPAEPALEIAVLTPQVVAAAAAQKAVNDAKRPWATATNTRETLYEGLAALSTKVWGTVQTLRIEDNTKALVEAIHKKLHGKWGVQVEEPEDEEEAKRARSASQLSYVSMAKNLEDMIETLGQIPQYVPKDEDRKITTLKLLLAQMVQLNDNMPTLETTLALARSKRNALYYTPVTGLIDTMKGVKGYLKTLGDNGKHPAYVSVSRLKFTKPPVKKNKAAEKRKREEAKKQKNTGEGK